jgi:hypothetical protein
MVQLISLAFQIEISQSMKNYYAIIFYYLKKDNLLNPNLISNFEIQTKFLIS